MDNKTATELVELARAGKMDEALALMGQEEAADKEASAMYRTLSNSIDKATTQGSMAIMKSLEKDNIVSVRDDIYEMRNDLAAMLEKWIKDYLKTAMNIS